MANSNATTKFHIGPVFPAKPTSTTIAAATPYVLIGDVTDLGEIGDEAQAIEYDVIGDGRTRTLKGVRNAGTFELTVARTASDPGQTALKAAELAATPYAFKTILEDATVIYFAGLVMSNKRKLGGANDVIQTTYTINVTSEVFEA